MGKCYYIDTEKSGRAQGRSEVHRLTASVMEGTEEAGQETAAMKEPERRSQKGPAAGSKKRERQQVAQARERKEEIGHR